MVARSWAVLDHVGAMLRRLWQQDGAQEPQDAPRWRPRGCKMAPRWHPGFKIQGLERSGEVLGVSLQAIVNDVGSIFKAFGMNFA